MHACTSPAPTPSAAPNIVTYVGTHLSFCLCPSTLLSIFVLKFIRPVYFVCVTRGCFAYSLTRMRRISRIDADGAVPNGWGVHNQDWKTNPARCPLFVHQLHEVDPTWPADRCTGSFVG
jgi:hypothetical protein